MTPTSMLPVSIPTPPTTCLDHPVSWLAYSAELIPQIRNCLIDRIHLVNELESKSNIGEPGKVEAIDVVLGHLLSQIECVYRGGICRRWPHRTPTGQPREPRSCLPHLRQLAALDVVEQRGRQAAGLLLDRTQPTATNAPAARACLAEAAKAVRQLVFCWADHIQDVPPPRLNRWWCEQLELRPPGPPLGCSARTRRRHRLLDRRRHQDARWVPSVA